MEDQGKVRQMVPKPMKGRRRVCVLIVEQTESGTTDFHLTWREPTDGAFRRRWTWCAPWASSATHVQPPDHTIDDVTRDVRDVLMWVI